MNEKPSLRRATKFFLGDTYNNLGKVILSNLFWTVCFIPCLIIGIKIRENSSPLTFLFLMSSFLLTSPALGGLFLLSRKISLREREIGMEDFFEGVKKYWKKSLILLAICLIVSGIIGGAIIFYGQLAKSYSLGILLWTLSLWALIFFLLIQLYFFPLMTNQNLGIKKTLKTSALLALDNVGFTAVIFLQEVIFLFLFLLTGLIFLGGASAIALLQTHAFLEVAKKYTGEEIRKELPRERERKSLRQVLREIFKPWEYD